jgi:glycerophosphoryl diester phosphodiesterase
LPKRAIFFSAFLHSFDDSSVEVTWMSYDKINEFQKRLRFGSMNRMRNQHQQIPILLVIVLCVLSWIFFSGWKPAETPVVTQKPTSDVQWSAEQTDAYAWTQSRWIAHALGDIDGVDYTNSREALEESIREGYSVVEFDLIQDERGVWILRHEQQRIEPYQLLTLSEFLNILEQHPTVTAVLDAKTRSLGGLQGVLAIVQHHAESIDSQLIDRIVIQTYSFEQYQSVTTQGVFKSVLLTLYGTSYTEDHVVAFAKEAQVKVITMPWTKANLRYIQRLNEAGVTVYVHTVNSSALYARLLAMGVHGVYTDVLLPLPSDQRRPSQE